MAIPDNVKAMADQAREESGAQKMQVKDMEAPQATDWKDTSAMEASREQQRQTALEQKAPEPTGPDKE